jgi:hypothetical protein
MVSVQLHHVFEKSAQAEIDRSRSLADSMCFANLRVLGISRDDGDEAAAQRSAAVITQLGLPPRSLFHRSQERLGLPWQPKWYKDSWP